MLLDVPVWVQVRAFETHLKAVIPPLEVSVTSFGNRGEYSTDIFKDLFSYISQERTPEPPDFLSSGGKVKHKRTEERKTRPNLFSWLSLRMSVCYPPSLRWNDATSGDWHLKTGCELNASFSLSPLGWCFSWSFAASYLFILIIQTQIKENGVAPWLDLSRLAVRADEERFTLTWLEADFCHYYSTHYLL